jgi:hypothetical protein
MALFITLNKKTTTYGACTLSVVHLHYTTFVL